MKKFFKRKNLIALALFLIGFKFLSPMVSNAQFAFWKQTPLSYGAWLIGPVGASSNQYLRTTNPADWSGTPMASPVGYITRITSANGKFFIRGSGSSAVSSDFGLTWTATDTNLFDGHNVTWNGTYYINRSLYSTNGINWSTIPNLPVATPYWALGRASDGAIMIGGYWGGLYQFGVTMDNGANWTSIPTYANWHNGNGVATNGTRVLFGLDSTRGLYTDDLFVTQIGDGGDTYDYDPYYGGGVWMRKAYSDIVIRTEDDTLGEWATVVSGNTGAGLDNRIAYGAGKWIVITSATAPFTIKLSSDRGLTWSNVGTATSGNLASVAFAGPPIPVIITSFPIRILFNQVFSETLDVEDSAGGNTFEITSGALPDGLSLNTSTGEISGTPNRMDTYTFTVEVTDSQSRTTSRTYTSAVVAETVAASWTQTSVYGGNQATNANMRDANLTTGGGTYYDGNYITADLGYSKLIHSVDLAGGNLPSLTNVAANYLNGRNLQISTDGTTWTNIAAPIAKVTETGYRTFVVNQNARYVRIYQVATGYMAATEMRIYQIGVYPFIDLNIPSRIDASVPFSMTPTVLDSYGAHTFALTSGSLPNGWSLNTSTGEISGTATEVGNFTFTISATNAGSDVGSRTFTTALVLEAESSVWTQTSYYSAYATNANMRDDDFTTGGTTASDGRHFTADLGASKLVHSVDIAGGNIAAGGFTNIATNYINNVVNLQISTDGTTWTNISAPVTGVADNAHKTYTINQNARYLRIYRPSSGGYMAITEFKIFLSGVYPVPYMVMPNRLPHGQAFSVTATTLDSMGTHTYAISSGTLPPGLSLNPTTGEISGTPTDEGLYPITLQTTSQYGYVGTKDYAIAVTIESETIIWSSSTPYNGSSVPTTANMRDGDYTTGALANAGSNRYIRADLGYSKVINSIDLAGGNVQGFPNMAYNYVNGYATIQISDDAVTWTTVHPTTSVVGIAEGAYTTFVINQSARYVQIHRVSSNYFGVSEMRVYTAGAYPYIDLQLPTRIAHGTPYSVTPTILDSHGTHTFAVTAGALPTGLTLNTSTGEISGTPTDADIYTFTLSATNTLGDVGTREFTLSVAVESETLIWSSSTPYNANSVPTTANMRDGVYTTGALANAGSNRYIRADLGSVKLLSSIDLSGGNVQGFPNMAANYVNSYATIQISDDATTWTTVHPTTSVVGIPESGYLSFRVYQSARYIQIHRVSSNYFGLSEARVYTSGAYPYPVYTLPERLDHLAVFSVTPTVLDSHGTHTFAVTAGALPTGLSLNASTGEISGTATALGIFNFTIEATNNLGDVGSRSFVLGVGKEEEGATWTQTAAYSGYTITNANMKDANAGTGAINSHGTNRHFTADLGSVMSLSSVDITGGNFGGFTNIAANYMNDRMVLQISTDGSAWTTITTLSGVPETGYKTFAINQSARYVRLFRAASDWTAVSEFRIYRAQ